jgi:hypothetical protein
MNDEFIDSGRADHVTAPDGGTEAAAIPDAESPDAVDETTN